jgi:integrase
MMFLLIKTIVALIALKGLEREFEKGEEQMACISKRRGRWVIDFYDQHGKRRWKTLPEGAAKGQAKEELRAIEDMLTRGVYLPHTKTPTFSEVARIWIEYKRPKLRETTWEVYEGHVRNHFHDLDGLKINWSTVVTIEQFITARQLDGMNLGNPEKDSCDSGADIELRSAAQIP